MINDIKCVFENIANKSRFYEFRGKENSYFYDSYSHLVHTIDTSLLNEIKTKVNSKSGKVIKNNIQRQEKFFEFYSRIEKTKHDKVPEISNNEVCSVMINTSTNCNLNCIYCYRNKGEKKVNNIKRIKKSIDFVMYKYMRNAKQYNFTYAMTSESSVDLSLLKQIAEEYINYENYYVTEEELIPENKGDFFYILTKIYERCSCSLCLKNFNLCETNMAAFINTLLEIPDLLSILEVSEAMLSDEVRKEISKKNKYGKWKLVKLNRKILEEKYPLFLKVKSTPSISFSVFTNGTCVTQSYLDFLHECSINPIMISIDGPQDVHDYNRKFLNNTGSYETIIRNIPVFIENGFNLRASAVITSNFPYPLEIALHLKSLGFLTAEMVTVRPGSSISFTVENVSLLIDGYEKLFIQIQNDLLKNDFTLLNFLRRNYCFLPLFLLIKRAKIIKRCEVDNQLVIDIDGKTYDCLYTCSEKRDEIGSIENGIVLGKRKRDIYVMNRMPCKKCWARYLCGGTCAFGSLKMTGDAYKADPVECRIRKYFAERCLKLLVFIFENNIAITNIVKMQV